MKIAVNIFLLVYILSIYCLGAIASNSPVTTYVVEQSISSPDRLTVHVNRTNKHATQLILHGVSMGIANQVQNVICDGQLIKEDKPGFWPIPQDCRKLHWQISLLENGKQPAGKQQSMKAGDFILLSGASSLPRLQDASSSEMLKIAIHEAKTIFPKPNLTRSIALPHPSAAPFFMLFNAKLVDSVTLGPIELTYFLDNPESVSALPSITAHMNGLKWLSTVIPGREKENFTIAWLGISKKQMSLGGAAGEGVLLTNYPYDGELTFGKSMLLYVALHEAFHQFAMHYAAQPAWVAESLAAYYGARAVQIALPNDTRSYALMERFQADGEHFSTGLLTIYRKVQKGDRSAYGAFYTKGLAFWLAVDKALQQNKGDNLDRRLIMVLQTQYDSHGKPINMRAMLNLSTKTWASLRKRFLD